MILRFKNATDHEGNEKAVFLNEAEEIEVVKFKDFLVALGSPDRGKLYRTSLFKEMPEIDFSLKRVKLVTTNTVYFFTIV